MTPKMTRGVPLLIISVIISCTLFKVKEPDLIDKMIISVRLTLTMEHQFSN